MIPIHTTSRSLLDRAGRNPPLRVLLPAIRPVMCSMGLYQDPEAGTNPPQRAGDKASGIHRRYFRLGGDRGDREESHLRVNIPVRKLGLHSTPSENNDNPIPRDRTSSKDSIIMMNLFFICMFVIVLLIIKDYEFLLR